jgi:hypothetical protein
MSKVVPSPVSIQPLIAPIEARVHKGRSGVAASRHIKHYCPSQSFPLLPPSYSRPSLHSSFTVVLRAIEVISIPDLDLVGLV